MGVRETAVVPDDGATKWIKAMAPEISEGVEP
jgi:hypothetical protein